MKLYFLRHADAPAGVDDAARPLSSKGKKQSRAVGRFLKRAGIEFDTAYSSPLVRAAQTAQIVLDTCGAAKLEMVEALLNEAPNARFDEWLKSLPEAKHVLLVGHAPSLAEQVRRLLGIADEGSLKLPKGGLICLGTEDRDRVTIKLFVTPKMLGLE